MLSTVSMDLTSKSYFTKHITFCNKMIRFVDEGKALDVMLGVFRKEV